MEREVAQGADEPTPLQRLAALDTSAVSDALDRLGQDGVVLGLRPLSSTRRYVGRAVTVKLDDDRGETVGRHLATAAVEASGPESTIVIEHGGRTDVAGWGGLLALAAHLRGVAGVVIDGACRDLDEIAALGLPVHGRCAVPITARGRVAEVGWNVPVVVAGVPVNPGDYVIGDQSGVVRVGASRIDDVVSAAERIMQHEKSMGARIREGEQVSTVMGKSYEKLAGKAAT